MKRKNLRHIPKRKADSNKGTFGKVLIAAGSAGMCGAAYLSALTAYRAGAGLVNRPHSRRKPSHPSGSLPEVIHCILYSALVLEGREEFKEMIILGTDEW
ncbi:MAG: hypothetical protein V8R59_01200 [Enterocloster sp.]